MAVPVDVPASWHNLCPSCPTPANHLPTALQACAYGGTHTLTHEVLPELGGCGVCGRIGDAHVFPAEAMIWCVVEEGGGNAHVYLLR